MASNPNYFNDVLLDLTERGQLLRREPARQKISEEYGVYSIFIDTPVALPECFNVELNKRATNLLYVGQAQCQSLRTRLIQQDLSGIGNSTFFRGVGAILGYRPESGSLHGKKNQNNYVFTQDDKKKIVDWIDTFIQIRWHVITETNVINDCEKHLINELYPLLNWKHNPRKFKPLEELRKECREIAKSAN